MWQLLILTIFLTVQSIFAQEKTTVDTIFNGKNIESITYKTNGQKTRF